MNDRDAEFPQSEDGDERAGEEAASAASSPAGAAQAAGAPGDPADSAASADSAGDGNPLTLEDFLAEAGESAPDEPATAPEDEHLADLRRLTAEYANYRKRVEREKQQLREVSIAEVLRSLLPVLDDLDRARAHGDLDEGPMAAIANKLRASIEKYGLEHFGAVGDAFDPQIHEALVQLPTPGATGQTIADVVETGYRLGERVIRVAKVAVAVPAE
ncbi:MAG: nucleotide exchange factor GrpE [Microbacterium sp.]|nr:nucleotide exchange factor GrpE [Microbacterium sp.]